MAADRHPGPASPPPTTRTGRPRHPEGWHLGTVVGVPVVLARSWFVIALVITVLFGPLVERQLPHLGAGAYLVAVTYAVLLLGSVLVHELAHAAMARATGLTASRIVLNLWGGHTQFESESTTPGRSFWIALVGPLSNGAIAAVAFAALPLAPDAGVARLLVIALAYTNGFVALFNLVPGLPLDGGRVLEAVIWRFTGDRSLAMTAAGWTGRAFAAGLVLVVIGLPLLAGRQPSLVSVIWSAMIGAMLWQGAGEAIRVAAVRRRLLRVSAASLLTPAVGVPAAWSVADAAEAARRHGVAEVVVLAEDGTPVGVVDPGAAASVPPDRRHLVPAASVARALPPGAVLDAGLAGQGLMDALATVPGHEWVATTGDGRVVGVLHSARLVAALSPPRSRR